MKIEIDNAILTSFFGEHPSVEIDANYIKQWIHRNGPSLSAIEAKTDHVSKFLFDYIVRRSHAQGT